MLDVLYASVDVIHCISCSLFGNHFMEIGNRPEQCMNRRCYKSCV